MQQMCSQLVFCLLYRGQTYLSGPTLLPADSRLWMTLISLNMYAFNIVHLELCFTFSNYYYNRVTVFIVIGTTLSRW
jgi:hypothetical protein